MSSSQIWMSSAVTLIIVSFQVAFRRFGEVGVGDEIIILYTTELPLDVERKKIETSFGSVASKRSACGILPRVWHSFQAYQRPSAPAAGSP